MIFFSFSLFAWFILHFDALNFLFLLLLPLNFVSVNCLCTIFKYIEWVINMKYYQTSEKNKIISVEKSNLLKSVPYNNHTNFMMWVEENSNIYCCCTSNLMNKTYFLVLLFIAYIFPRIFFNWKFCHFISQPLTH